MIEKIAASWDATRDIVGSLADISGLMLAIHLDNMLSYGIAAVVSIHIAVNVTAFIIHKRHARKTRKTQTIIRFTEDKLTGIPGPDPFRNRGLNIKD